MKLLIAGSRSYKKQHRKVVALIDRIVTESGWTGKITVVICGCAAGVDNAGRAWADANNIPVEEHPAQWDKYKLAAGYIRNEQMVKRLDNPEDRAIIIWDGVSRGTKHDIDLLRKYRKEFVCVNLQNKPMLDGLDS